MTKWFVLVLLSTAACTDVADANAAFQLFVGGAALATCCDGTSAGNDVLPKHGELASDPTILSVTVSCSSDEYPLFVTIQASDPGGSGDLSTCSAYATGGAGKAMFGRGGGCAPTIPMHCRSGESYIVDVVIANNAAGEASASVTRVASY